MGGEYLLLAHDNCSPAIRAELAGPSFHQPGSIMAPGIGYAPAMRDLCYTRIMDRDAAIARLRVHEGKLRRLGVRHLYLFGSTARGEARGDSDVDLFFDYERGRFGLYELMDVADAATTILGRKADVMTRDSLHRTLREKIEADALQVF